MKKLFSLVIIFLTVGHLVLNFAWAHSSYNYYWTVVSSTILVVLVGLATMFFLHREKFINTPIGTILLDAPSPKTLAIPYHPTSFDRLTMASFGGILISNLLFFLLTNPLFAIISLIIEASFLTFGFLFVWEQ
ncbi:MAG: hypothetical protein GY810_04110 [Aureispira sp.]|nr:hypothetical protein [Aureispira sp.]